MSLVALGAAAALLLLVGVAASNSSDLPTALGVLSFCGVLLVVGLVTALYYKADRALVVDSAGVKLLRAGRIVRDIPWAGIARFRFGAVPGVGSPAAQSTLFWVHGQGSSRGLSILESYYRVPSGSLWNASLATAKMAEARGIPVVRKDGVIRVFGP